MRIFVISWFFPPINSSEGMVTYKLIKESKHSFVVCSAISHKWSYSDKIDCVAENIKTISITTDSFDEWKKFTVDTFIAEHEKEKFDAIMSRSMPPESIEVAREIKKLYPDLPWIASFGDPIAANPYQIYDCITVDQGLGADQKDQIVASLKHNETRSYYFKGYEVMYKLKEIETYAINHADALIFPCKAQMEYTMQGHFNEKSFVIPHSFNKKMFNSPSVKNNKVEIVYIGHTDEKRSLECIVRAMHILNTQDTSIKDKIHFRFIGHIPENIRSMVYNYFLFDVISVEKNISFEESISVMNNSDWLIHVDANFEMLKDTGGSIFFAGKIADYMGTNAPILGLTGKNSPADEIINEAGGLTVVQSDIEELASILKKIAEGQIDIKANREYRDTYSSSNVAKKFDAIADSLKSHKKDEEKFVSICIPSYNVEKYLDRCLTSLVACESSKEFQVIIVNDGSKDRTLEIANSWKEKYPDIVEVIDKPNGGHGSTINAALAVARGTYFRVIDSDDWLESRNFDTLITKIKSLYIHPDVVSSDYCQVWMEDGVSCPVNKKREDLEYYKIYNFHDTDITGEYFTIHSCMFKTEVLKKANFKIQEHTFYVDVEYTFFPVPYINTVIFTNESLYRYAVGNPQQSINIDVFVKRYSHHDRVMRRLLLWFTDMQNSMLPYHKKYMQHLIVKYLLRTHYELSLEKNPDKVNAFALARDFDEFLYKTNRKIYKECARHYSLIKIARMSKFNHKIFAYLCNAKQCIKNIGKPFEKGFKNIRKKCKKYKYAFKSTSFYKTIRRKKSR